MKKIILISKSLTVFIIIAMLNFIPGQNKLFANVQFDEMKRLELQEAAQPVIRITRPKAEYNASVYRDPFIVQQPKEEPAEKPGEVEITLPALEIQGLVWGGENPQAIINGKVFKIGGVVEDAHIVDISKNGVDIFFQGRQFSIPAPAAAYAPKIEKDPIPKGGTND